MLAWQEGQECYRQAPKWVGLLRRAGGPSADGVGREQAVAMHHGRVRHPEVDRSAFAGFRFPPEVITVAVRWYLRYGLSYLHFPRTRRLPRHAGRNRPEVVSRDSWP